MKDQTALLEEFDVKFIIDSRGNRKEVVISYEKFRKLMQVIEDHIFLHSPEIQEQIEQSEEDRLFRLECGNKSVFSFQFSVFGYRLIAI